jgi:sugar phosphate isomerase/epimerase
MVRLLATQARSRKVEDVPSWAFDQYREAIDTLAATAAGITIENEVGDCVLTGPDAVESFFTTLDRRESVRFTWDVQNMWSLGTPPSIDLYRRLRPLIGYVHLKGGRANGDGALEWRSSLRDATWPIEEILREVIADGVSPVVCLNPSHGKAPEGWDGAGVVADDVRYLRELSIGVA